MHNSKLVLIVLLALLYFTFGKLSFFFLSENAFISIGLFAAEGIALAFVLYFGKHVIPGIFVGQTLLAYSNGLDIIPSMVIGIVNSTEAYLGLLILSKLTFNINLRTFRDYLLLFSVIALVLQPFSGLLSNAFLVYHGDIPPGAYFTSSLDWIIGNILGQFLFTPFLLLFFVNYKIIHLRHFLFIGFMSAVIFYSFAILIRVENPFLLFALTFPMVIFILSRWGLLYGTFVTVIIAAVAAYSVSLKIGAFFVQSQMNNVINYDLFIFAHILIVLITGILFDERKRHAEELQRTIYEEVEKNRKQQTLMLQQSRFAQMGEMISMIAHQWRQPLNSLGVSVQVLEQKYYNAQVNDDYMQGYKEKSMKLINHMSDTIDDFRSFFKPQKEKEMFSLIAVVDHAIDMLHPLLIQCKIDVIYENKTNVSLLGYKNELGQVIINILNNAKDALLVKEGEAKKITISFETDEKEVYVTIGDNGGGISDDIIDKIFDPYFSTKENRNGTGLGLYMTKIIIEEHCKGRVLVENSTAGALFTIVIPLKR